MARGAPGVRHADGGVHRTVSMGRQCPSTKAHRRQRMGLVAFNYFRCATTVTHDDAILGDSHRWAVSSPSMQVAGDRELAA